MRIFLLATLLYATSAFGQTCTTTISVGTNLSTTITNAAAGATICLNSGNWGSQSAPNVTKSPVVTIRSTTGIGARMTLNVGQGNGLTYDSLELNSFTISGSNTRNITISNSQVNDCSEITTTNMNNNNILIDGIEMVNTPSVCALNGGEGRLSIRWPNGPGSVAAGVTVKNSLFENLSPYTTGESDGIQIGSYGIVVGPGNIFRGLHQGGFGAHVDGVQGYGQSHITITGNFFDDNSVHIGFYDGSNTEVVTNNVFYRGAGGQHIQFGGGPVEFTHNTFFEMNSFSFSSKDEDTPPGTHDWTIRDNILVDTQIAFLGFSQSCTNCTLTHNMLDSQSSIAGGHTNPVNGSPTFVGGSTPTTWAGFQLTSTSIGYQAATTPAGTDMGTLVYGVDSGDGRPAAPTNLRIVMAWAKKMWGDNPPWWFANFLKRNATAVQ